MKKNTLLAFIAFLLIIPLCSCAHKKEDPKPATAESGDNSGTPEETEILCYPDISQIRSICELATLECYYHNVAKSTKEKGKGLSHIGEKERIFWIEYSGAAKFGIDVSQIKMETNGEQILITIPKAKLLGLSDYSFTEDSYISSADGINKNPISAKNQTEAIAAAESDIEKMFTNNDAMLMRAQDNAKELIENYIKQLGNISGIDYQIVWYYEENID